MTLAKMDHEIQEVKEILSRVDERVKVLIETNQNQSQRFDKFLDQHATLVERVTHLEAIIDTDKVDSFEKDYRELKNKMIEITIEAEEIAVLGAKIEKLNGIIKDIEINNKSTNKKLDNWSGWVVWISETLFKIAWVLGMAWILYKLGLSGVSFPP
jgi:chromosome segregation ATPase